MDQAPKESKNPNEIPEDQLNDFLETLKQCGRELEICDS